MDWESLNLPEAWDKFQKHVDLMFAGPYKAKIEAEKMRTFSSGLVVLCVKANLIQQAMCCNKYPIELL